MIQKKEGMEVKDYDASTTTLTTRMMNTVKVTVQEKLQYNNKTVTVSQCYKITENL